MDFFQIKERTNKYGTIELYPDFKVCRSKDLMVRGKSFYAIWDKDKGLWSTDEYDVQRLVDEELYSYAEKIKTDNNVRVKSMSSYSSKTWVEFKNYVAHLSDSSKILDDKIIFSNTSVTKNDFVSHKLNYALEEGPIDAWNELIGTLYEPDERMKIEWSIGAIISGESKSIQKFLVFYGDAGTGKSTVLNIIQKLFDGYYTMFDAKALTSSSNAFSTEVFKSNPLVAIQHDGDLSRIEDNTKLNSIVSHEEMIVNEKYKPSYPAKINCFLYVGTNKPVKITDAKSGIIRRLIDVRPSGKKVSAKKYSVLYSQIDFELGAIANHCLNVYREMGKNYYNGYKPLDMMFKTDVFFNFVEDSYFTFKENDGVSLKSAYGMYKEYCEESGTEMRLPMYKFREELKNYFENFEDVARINGAQVRSYYSGFKKDKFDKNKKVEKEEHQYAISFDYTESLLDKLYSDCPAQYANAKGTPNIKWDNVTTTLKDLDTSQCHYIRPPEHHIIIDFDLKDSNGKKSLEKNMEAASKWPPTYAELSNSGSGIHLHYIYTGDVNTLSAIYDENIEIKVFTKKSSLRRRLSKCNNIPVAEISSGLPLKGETKVVNFELVKNEKAIRTLITNNLNKMYSPNTKPSIDYIFNTLEDAYNSGITYNVLDMRNKVLAFANNSSNQSLYCINKVQDMKFQSKDYEEESVAANSASDDYYEQDIVFFDVEVFPNLFLLNWKYRGYDKPVIRMINPTPVEIEEFIKKKLVGYNNRRYDNHILYGRLLGYNNEQLYSLSQKLISKDNRTAFFAEAYNLSYTDIYDFCSKKQSLKVWEIELGLHHQELGLPWDQPVPEEKWVEVAEYCDNDVISTEAVFDANQADFIARQILSDLSGLSLNDTTNSHTTKIIFGNEKNPQKDFVYTDLSTIFPGYKYEYGKSLYRDEDPKEGGYVYAEPGMYYDVALLDVASMHPTSIEQLNLFGPYTKNFSALKATRIAIKHRDLVSAKNILSKISANMGDVLNKYLKDESVLDSLSYALKIVINSVYGLTSAKFDNKFKDPRNVDNIVAKRGALFMIDLKHAVQEKGFTVAHIKTDSIKIPNATPEIIDFVMEFGKKYGYIFEHECTYDRMCLVNNAVYIAKYKDGKHAGEWTATGAEFAHPYIFKTLFSKEPIIFEDLCETKSVTSAMYLDLNEKYGDVSAYEKELSKLKTDLYKNKEKQIGFSTESNFELRVKEKEIMDRISKLNELIPQGHNYIFVGKVGSFCPVISGVDGGLLVRESKTGKYDSVTGTKGYRWLESETIKNLGLQSKIDMDYFRKLVDDAKNHISEYGDFEMFISEEKLEWPEEDDLPWYTDDDVKENK